MTDITVSSIKEISLRRATVDDAEAIAAVRVESWQATYRGMIPDDYLNEMRIEDSMLQWRQILQAMSQAQDRICVYVAESEGHIIGFASGMMLPEPKLDMQAELTAVYLRPAWQRSGIGRRMVQKVARTLQAQGAESLLVWVISGNAIARNFYEELGAELLTEQAFSWDGMDLMEAGYGWRDLSVLMASVNAMRTSASLH
ncbi:GNAT family N-acetyltransferase [Undibacterium sp. TS12]|uniref:GNAT family N-acetyltransferase n=1 Tax=Undibacterium sp. TS12 TaxID=2908202 RepID=UPI001F4CBFEF|nr:GNAT family N-acetyltransferase [Undibacterium sp. TS12]MCH8622117.1 GNAT family N-acetyltransferase [Undibacterium sp. TS12]